MLGDHCRKLKERYYAAYASYADDQAPANDAPETVLRAVDPSHIENEETLDVGDLEPDVRDLVSMSHMLIEDLCHKGEHGVLLADLLEERAKRLARRWEADQVKALKAEGKGATVIAKELGIGRASVYRILNEAV